MKIKLYYLVHLLKCD